MTFRAFWCTTAMLLAGVAPALAQPGTDDAGLESPIDPSPDDGETSDTERGEDAPVPAATDTEPTEVDATADDEEGETEAASDGEEEAEGAEEEEAPRGPPSIPRRSVPSYDGRAPADGASAEEIAAWIPRILFFPVHLVFEYVLRAPIGWLITTAEREQWNALLINFFTWDEQKSGLVPTTLLDFGFLPSIGLYFWSNDFLTENNSLRAQVGFGGIDWLRATVSDRIQTSEETEMAFVVDAWRRPDFIFDGIGYDADIADRARYRRNSVAGRYEFHFRPWRASLIKFTAGVDWNDFELNGYDTDDDAEGQNPSLQDAVLRGIHELPPGIEGYTAYRQRLDIAIDSREARPAPGHGIRVEGFLDQGFNLTSATESRWMGYGGAVGGFVDVGANRVLALHGTVRFVDPLAAAPVPFSELAQLGGDALVMSGFLNGALRGRSAVAATLEYRYPIWVFLDGSLHASVGNVFGEQLSDFDFERLRLSFGLGFRSIGDRDQSFNVLVAFGSSPFDEPFEINSIRFVFGSQQGF